MWDTSVGGMGGVTAAAAMAVRAARIEPELSVSVMVDCMACNDDDDDDDDGWHTSRMVDIASVSYTHLTLLTIYSV